MMASSIRSKLDADFCLVVVLVRVKSKTGVIVASREEVDVDTVG